MDDTRDIFAPITLNWDGVDYVVPAERCMRLAYVVEMALRQGGSVSVFEVLKNPPVTATAMAYAAALRHAGAVVSDEIVYQAILKSLHSGSKDMLLRQTLISQIFDMLLPPDPLVTGDASDGASGDKPGKKTAAG